MQDHVIEPCHYKQLIFKQLTMTATLPTHSSEKSTPPFVISIRTSLIGLLWDLGFTNSVAPKILAFSNFFSFISTAMILDAPAFLHPMTAARPTAPSPNTAHTEPGSTCTHVQSHTLQTHSNSYRKHALHQQNYSAIFLNICSLLACF